jgi:hypothetical protein
MEDLRRRLEHAVWVDQRHRGRGGALPIRCDCDKRLGSVWATKGYTLMVWGAHVTQVRSLIHLRCPSSACARLDRYVRASRVIEAACAVARAGRRDVVAGIDI